MTGAPSRVDVWLRDAYLELAFAYPFDELLTTVDVSTVVGTAIYNYPAGVRAIRSLALLNTTTNQATPLDRKNIREIDTYNTTTQSVPQIYATWVVQGPPFVRHIVLRGVPNLVYTIRWRAWLAPVINATVSLTSLQMPDDWLEILDYSAAIRGFTELLEPDKATAIFNLIHGYTDPRTGKYQPGLIAMRMTTMQAEYAAGAFPLGELSQHSTAKRGA